MKYYAIFETSCPFASYFLDTLARQKSFVRTCERVRQAAIKYNRAHGYADYIGNYGAHAYQFHHIEIYENRTDLCEVAHMRFDNEAGDYQIVTITEYDE